MQYANESECGGIDGIGTVLTAVNCQLEQATTCGQQECTYHVWMDVVPSHRKCPHMLISYSFPLEFGVFGVHSLINQLDLLNSLDYC